ncbi:MAG: hypothetical protein K0B37_17905, partial [Bacteroidales bacterium]|nr:hypothetical protein [Bacteroidales bacterium]
MSFDLPESQTEINCWEYYKVQRTGGGGAKYLVLNQGGGYGLPWLTTPRFLFTQETNGEIEIYADQNFTMKIYLVNSDGTSETLEQEIQITATIQNWQTITFSVNPNELGIYRLKFEFEGLSNNKSIADNLKLDAPMYGDGCTGDIDFYTQVTNDKDLLLNPAGTFFPIGTTTITYAAYCNVCEIPSLSCSFSVTVNPFPEVTAGTYEPIECSDADDILLTGSPTGGVWSGTGVSGNQTDGYVFDPSEGTQTLTYSYTDENGCTSSDQATITVNSNIPPVANCNDNIIVYLDESFRGTLTAEEVNNNSTDNCKIESMSVSPNTFDLDDVGQTIQVTLTVTDNDGLTSTCTSDITVEPMAGSFAKCKDYTAYLDENGTVTIDASDVFNGDPTGFTLSVSPETFDCSNIGNNTVTLSVTKNSVTHTCEAVVNVVDNISPIITTNGDKDVFTDTDVCGATVEVSASATDNCSVGDPTGVRSDGLELDDLYPVGTTTIAWNVADENGNTATSTQTVTVVDNQNPTIATLEPISVFADLGVCTFASSQLTAPGAEDNCSVESVLPSPASLELGDNIVTWTVTDGSGNTATSTQTVTVVDNQNPTIATLEPISVFADLGVCTFASSQLT